MTTRAWLGFLLFGLTLPLLAAQPGPDGGGKKGGMFGPPRKLVAQFDKDGDGRLNLEERTAARASSRKKAPRGWGASAPRAASAPASSWPSRS